MNKRGRVLRALKTSRALELLPPFLKSLEKSVHDETKVASIKTETENFLLVEKELPKSSGMLFHQ